MKTPRYETPAFTLEEGELVRQPAGSRTALRYTAKSARHVDGGFEVSVNALLFDAQDRFIGKRGADRSRTVLADRATWVHEIDNDWLSTATTVVYEIEHRFDFRRKIVAGELPALPPEADGSDYHRWLDRIDPRTLEDHIVRYDFSLWARGSSIDITLMKYPKLAVDSCRSELELDLLDAERAVSATRNLNVTAYGAQPGCDDTSISIDRRAMHALRFFELRGRTETRAFARYRVDNLR